MPQPTVEADDDNLYPLPHDPVSRSSDIPICTHTPPSILSFVRKNVGKDLSTIAMPVTYNEPTTAFTRAVSETPALGEERKWVHYGLTSTDVVDTALSYILKQANEIILKDLENFVSILANKAKSINTQS